MPEGPSVEQGNSPEQGSNPVREASDNFLTRMHGSTMVLLSVAVSAEALAVRSLLEGDPGTALGKGILGGALIAFALLAERRARRLDAQSARILAGRTAERNEQTGS